MATRKTTEAPKRAATTTRKKKVSAEDAVRAYQNDPSINTGIVENSLTEGQTQAVEAIDEAMRPLEEMELNRVTVMGTIDGYLQQAKATSIEGLRGKDITHVPYMSATKNSLRGMLEHRFRLGLSKTVGIVVHADDKCRGVDVNATLGLQNGFKEQKEVIIARGTKFNVRRITYFDDFGEAVPVLHLYAI